MNAVLLKISLRLFICIQMIIIYVDIILLIILTVTVVGIVYCKMYKARNYIQGNPQLDIVKLAVLPQLGFLAVLLLVVFVCGYCAFRVHRMQQNGQVAILLRPTKVLFSHKTEDNSEQLRTVVAYRNPFTGDYCVHKNREPKGYLNSTQSLASTDSGLSDEYEPLNLPPLPGDNTNMPREELQVNNFPHTEMQTDDYSAKKTWKWDYTEYQI